MKVPNAHPREQPSAFSLRLARATAFMLTLGVFLAAACGPPPAARAPLTEGVISNRAQPASEPAEISPRPPTAEEQQRDLDKEAIGAALVALERMASAAASAQGNCDAMVGAVTNSIYSEIDLWVRLQEISADPKREVALNSAEVPLGEGMRRFAEALGECAFDRRIQQSLEAMTFASAGGP